MAVAVVHQLCTSYAQPSCGRYRTFCLHITIRCRPYKFRGETDTHVSQMVSVVPDRSPFSMAGSYQPMAPPNAFGGVGDLQNPGSAVAAGMAIPMPDIIRDGNNNSNRTVPYTRIVGINNDDRVKQIEALRGGSLAFIGRTPFRKRATPARVTPGGIDSFSAMASIDHVIGALKEGNPLKLVPDNADVVAQIQTHVENGTRRPDGTPQPFINPPADLTNFFRPPRGENGSCFLYPLEDHTESPNERKDTSSSGKRNRIEGWEGNTKVPKHAATVFLEALYRDWGNDVDGVQPFTRWTPDGLVIYKYQTSDDPVSSGNHMALDYQLDQKQGAMFNIAVQGPCLSIDWTGQADLEMAKRCICLPRNNYYLLVVATVGTDDKNNKVLKDCRLLRTTSHDLASHANSLEYMNLNEDELIIGGWKIGSVIDNAAAPMRQHSGPSLMAPDRNSSLMGTRVAVSIRFVDSFYLHQKYFFEPTDTRNTPYGASRLRTKL